MNDLSTEIRIGADASGVEAGVGRAKRSLKDLGDSARSAGQTVAAAGKQAGESLATVGDGGEAAAKKIQRDTRSMQSSLQRYLATLEAGSKDSRKYWESMADFKGVDKAALRPLLDQLDAYKAKANAAADASSAFKLSVGGFGVAATALTAVSATAGVAAKAMFDASVSAERLRTMLDFSTGGNSAREIEYLRGVTARLGLEFTSTAKAYGQFQAAAKGTALEGDKARAVFESVAKASAVMGLSADDTSGVLLALQQMISKGTVSAEELRGQLGERLPGSFQVAARAMGVTTAELGKMLEQGQIVADDFLPKFGKALEQNLGGAAEKAANRLDASVNRLNTAWERLKQNGGDAGTSSFMAGQYEILADGFNGVSEAMERARSNGSGFIGQMSAGAVAVAKFANPLQAFSYTAIESGNALKQAEEEFAALQARGDQMGGNIYYKAEMARLAALIKELKTAQAEKDKLTKGDDSKINPGIVASGQGRERYYQQREKDEEAANAFRLNQAGVPASYLKDMAELIRLNQAGVIVGKEYTDALEKQQDELLKKTGAVKSSNAVANQEQNAYESLIASIRAKIEADKLEIAGGTALTESQRLRIKLDQDLAAGRIKLGSAHEKSVRLALEELSASEAAALAAKTLAKANADAAQARGKYLTSLASGVDKIKADTAAQIEATARLGLSKEAIADLDAAKLEMLATDLELQAIKALDRNLDEQTYNALKQQAEAYRELAAAKKAGAAKEMELDLVKANQDAAKKAKDEWQRAADDINRSLTDALMRGFESGKGFAENLRSTLKNMFSTLVLRPIISAAMSPVAGAINGMLYGNAAGVAGAGNSLLGGIQTASNLNTLWGAGSQALYGATAGASAASLGYANLVGMAGGDAIGALATANGMWAGVATGAQAAAQSAIAANLAVEAGTAAALPAGTMATAAGGGAAAGGGIMSSLGAAMPWIAGAAAIMSIVSSLDDSGTYHTGGAAQYNAATGLRTSLGFRDNEEGLPSYNPRDNIDNQFGTGFGYVERGDQTISAVSTLAQALGTALDGVAVAFGQKAGYEIATAFADDTSEDGAWGALRISKDGQELLNWQDTRTSRWAPKEFGDGEEGYKQYLAAVAKDTRQVLLDMDLPGWADKMLNSIGDSASMEQLTGVLTQIGVVQSAFVSLGKSMEMFSGLSEDMQSGLLKASGSIDALTSNAGAFYQGFFSEAERVDALTAQLNSALSSFDLSIDPAMGDAAKAQFRAAVEGAFAAGNAEMASGLLALSSSFATAADYYEQAAATQVNAAKQAAKAIEDLFNSALSRVSSNRFDLENQLLTQVGQGDLVQQRVDQRDLAELTKGLPEDQAAKVREQFEANIKLRDQYEANQLAADNLAAAMGQLKEQQDAATQAQKDMLQSTVTSAKKAVDDLRSIFDFVGDAIKELRGDVVSTAGMQAEQARAFIQRASTLMRSGTVVDSGQLQAAIRTASGSVQTGAYASQFEADNARLLLANELAGLQEGTAGQLTVAEKHLSVAEQQLNALNVIAASINSLASAQAVAAGQPRDQWATVSGQQVYASSGGAVGLNNGSDIDIYGKDGSRFTGSEAIAFVRNQIAANDEASVYAEATKTGISAKALDELMGWAAGTSNDWAKANGLPQFAIGTNYVPRDMVAQIHEGEAIVPKAFNPWANGMSGGSPQATERLLQQLVADNRVQAGEIVRLNTRIAKLMERWDGEGLPQARSEAAV